MRTEFGALVLAVALGAAACSQEADDTPAEGHAPSRPDDSQGADKARPSEAPPLRVRPPAFAGRWYEGEKAALERQVSGLLSSAKKVPLGGQLYALIAPHAGYVYSGQVAGWGFRQIEREKFDRAVVIAPSHSGRFQGFSIMDVDAYRTPLGVIELDKAACNALRSHRLHVKADRLHASEHAVEIELPFLQQTLSDFTLVPILVGSLAPGDAADVATAVKKHVSPRTLVIASSDFTHYGPNYRYMPFRENVEENIRKLDMGAVDLIVAKDFDGYMGYLAQKQPTICGRNGIAILLKMLPASAKGKTIKYDTSGRITGDFTNSVSYVSVAFTVPVESAAATEDELSIAEQKTLLRMARDTVESHVRGGRSPDEKNYTLTPRLKARAGTFVTLKKAGRLRGCIGRIGYPEVADALPPLYKAVMLMSVESSTRDPRFRPVRAEELKDIEIEISALTIAKEISGPEGFQVGKHGIIIRKGRRGAVYLPQVAPEQGWDRDTTLRHLCRKAGLSADEWQNPGMKFFVFTAQVFDESLLKAEAD